MNRKYLIIGAIVAIIAVLAIIVAMVVVPHEPTRPVVYIIYHSDKGDLSYTDSAYRGLFAAQEDMQFTKREYSMSTPVNFSRLLTGTAAEKPGFVITLGYDKAGFTQALATEHPDIRFLAIDQTGIGSGNVRAYEITSYGESYLAGVLAASATKTGRVGIVLGTQSTLLEAFRLGYVDGVHAVSPTIPVDQAYVRDNSTTGFYDTDRAAEISGGMYANGADVVYAVAGYSNIGVIREAKKAPGRYIIGVDSDQTYLGPGVVLASAVKHVDRVVYTGIAKYINGSFTGGDEVAGLKEGVTGLSFNPKFEHYNSTVRAWDAKAQEEEAKYLRSRALSVQK
ncbi:MAG: BMP family ABC transporter substrate-binding protein [Methanoregula sp.]|jgi:basic membrane protein A|uniref:BMP family lipoprotein n=1 Tax=Methanoregula sp. TaxID=2052170 RepID=UPI0025E9FC10|nr:BMP family ABC transporter substrate-binding protein [Methanoregula sp.]MCK9631295.1 BMP family ABC transporter substrate-binding protein [Methanoregula sp.]